MARLNEPENKPVAPRVPTRPGRRPFAAVARISLLAVVIAILGACGAEGSAPPSDPAATQEQATKTTGEAQPETAVSEPEPDGELGPPVLGDEGAPVTMVEYADYQ